MFFFHLLKRDLYLRFRDTIKISLFLILVYSAMIVYCIWHQFNSYDGQYVSPYTGFYQLFQGVDFISLVYFYKDNRFVFPFYWLFFQIVPLLMVGQFAYSDTQKNGTYLFPRVKRRPLLWLSKMISLLAYITTIWVMLYFIWAIVYFLFLYVQSPSYVRYSHTLMTIMGTMAIQLIVSYLLSIIFELLTFYMPTIVALCCIIIYLIFSVFLHSIFVLGSFVMPRRWYFVDHSSVQLLAANHHTIEPKELLWVTLGIIVLTTIVGSFRFRNLDVIGD